MEKSTETLIELVEELYGNWLCRFEAFRKFVTLWANLATFARESRRIQEDEVQSLREEIESLKSQLEEIRTLKTVRTPYQDRGLSASSILDRISEEYNNQAE